MKKNKYIYEIGDINDGEEISLFLKNFTLNNNIDFIYARDLNAVESLQKTSKESLFAVGRDKVTKKILGFGAVSINEMLINEKVENVAYLTLLRMQKDVFGHISECYKIIEDFCKNNNVRYTFTTILENNKYTKKMLTKKHKNIPKYTKYGSYHVKFFGKSILSKTKYTLKKCENKNELISFIEKQIKSKIFTLNLIQNLRQDNLFGLSYKDFYILVDKKNEILACGVLWNQKEYKQMFLKTDLKIYDFLRVINNLCAEIFGLPKFPKKNILINYSTLSFVFYKEEKYIKSLIKEFSHILNDENDFFVYGSTKKIPIFSLFDYKSNIYTVEWDNIDNAIFPENINLECGLL